MSEKMPERIWSEIRIDHFDELNQLYYVDAWLTDDDNEEGEVIARIYPATGYVEYVDERAENDPYVKEVIREAFDMIHDTKIQLTKTYSDKIRKIAELNAEIKKLSGEVNDMLDKVGYGSTYAYAGDVSPIQAITKEDIVTPVFEDNNKILVDGSTKAKANNDGVYVDQFHSYCEDDYFGNFYVKLDDGTYARIHFEG